MDLAKYSFVSWMRQGLGQQIAQTDTLGTGNAGITGRATISAKVVLNTSDQISQNLELIGPGDIIGIDSKNIVRVHPEPGTPNFEPNYLPFIEFYQDSFIWDYTPAKASGDKLRPWLMLIVLEESEYSYTENPEGPLDYITLSVGHDVVFPPETQSWAFGHVHVNVDLSDMGQNVISGALSKLKAQLSANPDFAVCRLLSPRKLEPSKRYRGCLVPAFESGRLAGLSEDGSTVDAQLPSWNTTSGHGSTKPDQFPVYHSWEFQSGPFGDFEYLARLLEGRVLPPEVGFQLLEVEADPFFAVPDVSSDSLTRMGGALKPVDGEYQDFDNKTAWEKAIAELVNLNRHAQYPDSGLVIFPNNPFTGSGDSVKEDPVITPPLYGKWHAIARTVEPEIVQPDTPEVLWLRTLNTDPRHRAAAGLGTDIIQTHQDKYMEIAWEQVGAILEANQILRQAQLGIEIVSRLYDRHIASLDDFDQLSILGPLLPYIKCGSDSLYKLFAQSILPMAVFDPAFRYLSKPRGRIRNQLTDQSNGDETIIYSMYDDYQHYLKFNFFSAGKISGSLRYHSSPAVPEPDALISQDLLLTTDATYNPDFGFSDPPSSADDLDPNIPPNPGASDAQFIDVLLDGTAGLFGGIGRTNFKVPLLGLNLAIPFTDIFNCAKEGIAPAGNIKDRVLKKIGTEAELDAIVPILAAPDYTEPMYKKLLAKDPNYILPNIEAMPRNTITLLTANQEFIESYMVGLNHEMARELLWNEYPTDQRGSYFRQFWDVSSFVNTNGLTDEDLKDIKPIHEWAGFEALGEHNHRIQPGEDPPLVLAIRGEVVNRYPDLVIFAVKAHFDTDGDGNQIRTFDDTSAEKYPIYSAAIPPDITFLGFDITADEACGDGISDAGWFFGLRQQPAGPRFGLDELLPDDTPSAISSWNDLTWQHLSNPNFVDTSSTFSGTPTDDDNNPSLAWGNTSADMAYILYQVPFGLFIHAKEMLPDQ